MPALVVPAVATTATTGAGFVSASRAARSASAVSTWSREGITNGSMPRRCSAEPTEEWASSLIAQRMWRGSWSRCLRRPSSRATASAERLPSDPPETKVPQVLAGMPARSARNASSWFSATTTPADSR